MIQILCMDRDKLVGLAQDLIKVRSTNPPGNEKEVADILKKRLEAIGMKVEYFEEAYGRPNILATWDGGEGKTVVLQGHMDTVPAKKDYWKHDPFSGVVEDGKIYGRGATDMKGPLASMVNAIESLKEEGFEPKGKIMFLGCVNEETGDSDEIGMRLMAPKMKERFDNGLMIIGDVSNLDVVTAEKGALWLEFISKGKEAHGSTPWEGVNAIEKLGKFLVDLNNAKLPIKHVMLGESTISINTIFGGMKTNVVPGEARASVDIRLVPGQDKEEVLGIIRNLIKNLQEEDPEVDIEFTEEVYEPAVEIDQKQDFIPILLECIKARGRAGKLKAEHGATGSGNFIREGIPTVVFGPGNPDQAHITDEFVEIKDLEDASLIYQDFIKKYLG